MFVAEAGVSEFDAVEGCAVHFVFLSIIFLMTKPQTKPMISITMEHTTPIETALAMDIGLLMKFKLSTHNRRGNIVGYYINIIKYRTAIIMKLIPLDFSGSQ